jgi:hypothetical protein
LLLLKIYNAITLTSGNAHKLHADAVGQSFATHIQCLQLGRLFRVPVGIRVVGDELAVP